MSLPSMSVTPLVSSIKHPMEDIKGDMVDLALRCPLYTVRDQALKGLNRPYGTISGSLSSLIPALSRTYGVSERERERERERTEVLSYIMFIA